MKYSLSMAVLALVLFAAEAGAQNTVFVVRHAERADTVAGAAPAMAADPDLSAAGQARALSLASMLKNAGVTTIFATEYKRTQQTAAPLAAALGITVTTVPSKDTAGLVQQVKAASGNVLVVGHSNTVPDVIVALGIGSPPRVDDAEYDNLFVVARGETPLVVRLRYR